MWTISLKRPLKYFKSYLMDLGHVCLLFFFVVCSNIDVNLSHNCGSSSQVFNIIVEIISRYKIPFVKSTHRQVYPMSSRETASQTVIFFSKITQTFCTISVNFGFWWWSFVICLFLVIWCPLFRAKVWVWTIPLSSSTLLVCLPQALFVCRLDCYLWDPNVRSLTCLDVLVGNVSKTDIKMSSFCVSTCLIMIASFLRFVFPTFSCSL